eukprot:scaffold138272_cov13-Tisochrysis_lutea.AAC.1
MCVSRDSSNLPQTEEFIAARSTGPDSEPPRKRKRSRNRGSITPPVHLTLMSYPHTKDNAIQRTAPSPD